MCNTIPPLNQNTIDIKKTFDFIILFTCFNTSLSLKGFLEVSNRDIMILYRLVFEILFEGVFGGVKQGYYDSLSVGF